MSAQEAPKVCRSCWEGQHEHSPSPFLDCHCPCRELGKLRKDGVRTPAEWAKEDERRTEIERRMKAVEKRAHEIGILAQGMANAAREAGLTSGGRKGK